MVLSPSKLINSVTKPPKLCASVDICVRIQINTYLKVSSPPLPRMVVAVEVDVIECCEARFLGDLLLGMGEKEDGRMWVSGFRQ